MLNSCPRSTDQKGEVSSSLVLIQLDLLLARSKMVFVSPLIAAEHSPVILPGAMMYRELIWHALLSAMFSANVDDSECKVKTYKGNIQIRTIRIKI